MERARGAPGCVPQRVLRGGFNLPEDVWEVFLEVFPEARAMGVPLRAPVALRPIRVG
jgi:hypothetical protein